MWNRVEFKERGKAAFKRNYASAVAVAFIMGLISWILNRGTNTGDSLKITFENNFYPSESSMGAVIEALQSTGAGIMATIFGIVLVLVTIVSLLLKVFIEYNLQVGGAKFFIDNQTSKPGIDTILHGFRSGHYGNIVKIMFLKNLYTALWSLLFVIPGIIKSYEYRMVPYILAENPGMNREDVFQISKEMMDGQKWNMFVLDLSFIGWNILSSFTFGLLAIFYVNPYVEATNAEVYAWNKEKAFEKGYIR